MEPGQATLELLGNARCLESELAEIPSAHIERSLSGLDASGHTGEELPKPGWGKKDNRSVR